MVKSLRVAHIITDLNTGGAEMMLYKILKQNSDSYNYESIVISLMKPGNLGEKIKDLKVPVISLNLIPGSIPSVRSLFKLFKILNEFKPSIIQGWMYHGNLFSVISKLRFPKVRLIFNIRQTLYSLRNEKISTRIVIILNMLLSRIAYKTVYNSYLSKNQHLSIGFSKRNAMVIGNGFDLNTFKPDVNERLQVRDRLNIQNDEFLVTHISRFHPMKDHSTLLESIKLTITSNKQIKFLLVGKDIENNIELEKKSQELEIHENVIFLGERNDISNILASSDLNLLTSAWGEGFPNILGESLASEVLCVATNVGDSKLIVNEFGLVVDPGSPMEIASAIIEVLSMDPDERVALGKEARKYIGENYSIDKIFVNYLNMYKGY